MTAGPERPGAPGPDSRAPLPHGGGLDLLRQLRETGYLELVSQGPAPALPGAGPPPAARTVIMLDGDVIVQVSRDDLEPAFWERHQAMVERRLRELQATLRNLTAGAILGHAGAFGGLVWIGQLFDDLSFTGLDRASIVSWGWHAALPLLLPAAATVALRLGLKLWLRRKVDRVFGRLRL